MDAHAVIVAFIAVQRAAELGLSRRNTRRLVAQGAVVVPEPGYPWIVALHAAWLAALAFAIPPEAAVQPLFLAAYGILLALRVWVMASLGRFWTTRIVSLPGAPLVRRGPYRWLAHPNYLVVAGELAVAPLIFGAWEIAAMFSILNLPLLARRIAAEEAAIEARRAAATDAGHNSAPVANPGA